MTTLLLSASRHPVRVFVALIALAAGLSGGTCAGILWILSEGDD